MSRTTIAILVGLLFFTLAYGGIIVFEKTVGYPVFLDNCDSILSTDYQVATEDVSECLKAMNHPFVNYWLEVYLLGGFLAFMVGLLASWSVLISQEIRHG